MKKVRKFQTGGVSNLSFREEKQKEIENKKIEREAKAQSKKEAMAQRAYKEAAAMYENELRLDPQDTNPIGYKMRKFEDKIGDKVRSIGKNVFGTNQMTSMDDEAQMQARKDVKGYKKGGMATKKPIKMNDGGMPMVMKDGKKVPAFAADGVGKMKHGGKVHSDMAKDKPMMKKVAAKAVKGHEKRMHGMAKGGGIEIKGKTKGKMIKMKSGGRAC